MSETRGPVEVTTLGRGDYRRAKSPVILRGGARNWPAFKRWTPELLAHLGKGLPVRVTYGNAEQGTTHLQTLNLDEYIGRCFRASVSDRAEWSKTRMPYVHELRMKGPLQSLQTDVCLGEILRWCDVVLETALWIGPGGTVTGLHYDHPDNVVGQIVGSKRFTFFHPDDSPYLYPSQKYDMGSTIAQVDALSPDTAKYPRFSNARPYSVVMNSGDIMYTPSGWWHQVESLEPSITVANFFAQPAQARKMMKVVAGRMAHELRVFRWGDCTCHKGSKGIASPFPAEGN